MKYFNLSAEEKTLLEEFERGHGKEIKNLAQAKRKYQQYAKNTLNKTKNINIRLSLKDIQKLKAKAVKNGLPYQTLIAAVLHQYADEKITANL